MKREFFTKSVISPVEIDALLGACALVRSQEVSQELLVQFGFNEQTYDALARAEEVLRRLKPTRRREYKR